MIFNKFQIFYFILAVSSTSVLADLQPCDLISIGSWEGSVEEPADQSENPLPETVVQTTNTKIP